MKKIYNIHGLIGIESDIDIPRIPRYFLTNKAKKTDLVIKEVKDIALPKDLNRIGLSYYGGRGTCYLVYEAFPKFTIKVAIDNLFGKKTRVFFNKPAYMAEKAGSLGREFSVSDLASTISEIKLNNKNYALLHSAGVEKDGNTYLISGWSETGKSSTMIALAREGFRLLGDDYVILSENGTTLCYPLDVGIFPHTKNLELVKLSGKKKFKAAAKCLISKVRVLESPGFITTTERVELSKIGEIAECGDLQKVFLLEGGGANEVRKISNEEATSRLYTTTSMWRYPSNPVKTMLFAFSYLNAIDLHGVFERRLKEIIEWGIRDAECFIVKGNKRKFPELIKSAVTGTTRFS